MYEIKKRLSQLILVAPYMYVRRQVSAGDLDRKSVV
jgi:hypothetical protein